MLSVCSNFLSVCLNNYATLSITITLQTRYNTDIGIHNIRLPYKQGCGVGSPVILLRLRAISIIRLQPDSDLQLY